MIRAGIMAMVKAVSGGCLVLVRATVQYNEFCKARQSLANLPLSA